jgi:uncharacterized membrane protein
VFNWFKSPQLSKADEQQIVRGIQAAEKNTRAEIRVHIARRLKAFSALEEAQGIFNSLGMHQTELRNGVLLYVCLREKKFAIVGDIGIHSHVSETFWNEVRDEMQLLFAEEKVASAICHGIGRAGEKLKQYFPADGNHNPNELSDEISRS